jgi:eukaryotic-like serine/threonine-protein kinase
MPDTPPSVADPQLAARITQVLGETFELDREVGRGGMGIVYRARDRRLKRVVAIKVLPPELAFRSDIRARFLREAETAAQLTHPHIVPIYAVDERDGIVYFVMAYVDGDTLGTRLARGALPVAVAERIVREVADALAYAHAHGVIHRDIKPDNILLTHDGGTVMVTDFGIARAVSGATGAETRLTATGVAIGTPAYMSPEQCAGDKEVDGRSDLYSLGVVAYHMLAGSPPFGGSSNAGMLVKHLSERPVPVQQRRPDTPPAFANAVMRLLEKDPADRFPTAAALLGSLDSREASPASASIPRAVSAPAAAAPATAPTPTLGGALDNPSRSSRTADRKARKDKRGDRDDENAPLPVRIRSFRRMTATFAGTTAFLFAINAFTDTSYWWAVWPMMGMGMGFAVRLGKLWADGVTLAEIFGRDARASVRGGAPSAIAIAARQTSASLAAVRHATPTEEYKAARLVPWEVLNGPYGSAVRRAAADYTSITHLLSTLSEASRASIPDVQPTANNLLEQIATLAIALHRLGADVPPERRTQFSERRDALSAQMERAGIVLQTIALDLLRLRSAGAQDGGIDSATQQARAVLREIDYVLSAADELRDL